MRATFKRNLRGLDVIQAVYAFVMVLGLREVFIGSHQFFTNVLFGASPPSTNETVIFVLLFLNVVFLGMRFFWVPRNLRRIIYAGAKWNGSDRNILGLSDSFLAANWFIVVMHGMLFFMLGAEFEFIVFSLTGSSVLEPRDLSGYFVIHILLLSGNALWIGFLARREMVMWRRAGSPRGEPPGGVIWFRNNLVFALLALAPFVVVDACQTSVATCGPELGLGPVDPAAFGPFSPLNIHAVYEVVAQGVAVVGGLERYVVAYWILLCFLINSLWDLLTTGSYYVILEDIDFDEVDGEDIGGGGAPGPQPDCPPGARTVGSDPPDRRPA